MAQTIVKKILARIYGHGRGWAFSQSDFADLGSRAAIDSTLHRLQKDGVVERALRGIYYYPRHSQLLQKRIAPDIDQVANALARKYAWRIQPDSATAQNLLGLTTQVPAQAVYLSDGPSRRYKVGNRALSFRHTALKLVGFQLPESRLVVQALKGLGEERVTPQILSHIASQLTVELRRRMLLDTRTATGWIYAAIQAMARQEPHA